MHRRSVSFDFESLALDLGDCIGVESCVDFKTTVAMDVDVDGHVGSRTSEKMERAEKGFPPPIPSLVGDGEDCPVAMPWVMKRYYSGDGRLVIRGERVKRREYFTADRSNGRLTLRLFPLNDDEVEGGHDDDDDENGGDVVDNDDQTVVETEEEESIISNREAVGSFLGNGGAPVVVVVGGGGGGGKLYQCCNMRRSSCMLEEIAMAAVRSVHT